MILDGCPSSVSSPFRFLAQGGLESELHNAAGGDGHTQRGKAGTEAVHCFLRRGVAGRGGNVDELFSVVRVNDLGEGKDVFGDVVTMLSAATGDYDFTGLVPTLDHVEDDIFLKHFVIAESGLAGFKHMQAAQFHMPEKVFTERAEVRAVAKAPWRDADELPTGNQ